MKEKMLPDKMLPDKTVTTSKHGREVGFVIFHSIRNSNWEGVMLVVNNKCQPHMPQTPTYTIELIAVQISKSQPVMMISVYRPLWHTISNSTDAMSNVLHKC